MLNKSILMGRLTKDVELRYTQSNIPVASFTLAVDRSIRNASEGQQTVDFINIVAWRNTAEFVSKWFKKGQLVAVSGRLQARNWTDNDGNSRTTVEVVADECFFAESKRSNEGTAPTLAPDRSNSTELSMPDGMPPFASFEELVGNDGELPF